MSRAKKSADRIREVIPLSSVLYRYGYGVIEDAGYREQQFSCDLHGDGRDNAPSARLYPDSNKFYCFACGRARDAISLTQEKEGLSFWNAVRKLEKEYGLDPLPWEPTEEKIRLEDTLFVTKGQTPKQVLHRAERLIQGFYEDGKDPIQIARFWEAHDKIYWYLNKDDADEEVCLKLAGQVLEHIKNFYKPTQ